MIKESTVCEGCILFAICTKICEPAKDQMHKSRDEIYTILKMKGGNGLLKLAQILRVDFIKKYSVVALMPKKIDAYIKAADYAIVKGYISNNDPVIQDLNQCKANLRRCRTIQLRIKKNSKRKHGR